MSRTGTVVAGHYFLSVEGLALARYCVRDSAAIAPRVEETLHIAATMDEFPNTLTIPMIEHDIEEGYTLWAGTYDGPNPAIEAEEPVVHAMLDGIPRGTALDAACGTGRHAAKLAALGHEVIGVDATGAMLAIARDKVPTADFRLGRLEQLPVDECSIDVVTCSLALTHVEDLQPVVREFARVMKPGATAVLSDIHPLNTMVGGNVAGFPGADIRDGIPYVVNLTHQISDYIAAFNDAGLSIVECLEPQWGEAQFKSLPGYPVYPDACVQAFGGLPYLLIWRLARDD
jgi:2-polyprenyl-3-methyl-5-hydroxy-6-metoxy-1,4-benzoquinol methylase